VSFPTLSYIATFSLFIPVFFGFKKFERLQYEMKTLVILLFISLVSGNVALYLALKGISNLWIFHITTLIEFSFLMFILARWQVHKLAKLILYSLIPFYAILWTIAKFTIENLRHFDNFTSTLANSILVIAALGTLIMIVWNRTGNLLKDIRVWVLTAILVYYAGNFMLLGLSNLILALPIQKIETAWSIQWTVLILSNLLYTGGFLCRQTQ
jgi:hypothetical protein